MDHFKALVDSATKTWMGFIPGHPQADVEGNIYMMLPKGFELNDRRNIRIMLRNYSVSIVWNQHLHHGLIGLI